jgi:hypothetical protein
LLAIKRIFPAFLAAHYSATNRSLIFAYAGARVTAARRNTISVSSAFCSCRKGLIISSFASIVSNLLYRKDNSQKNDKQNNNNPENLLVVVDSDAL